MTNESRNGHVIQFPSNLSHNNPYHRNEPSFIGLSLGVALFFFSSQTLSKSVISKITSVLNVCNILQQMKKWILFKFATDFKVV